MFYNTQNVASPQKNMKIKIKIKIKKKKKEKKNLRERK